MTSTVRPGVVIFAGGHRRLADFYAAMASLRVDLADDTLLRPAMLRVTFLFLAFTTWVARSRRRQAPQFVQAVCLTRTRHEQS